MSSRFRKHISILCYVLLLFFVGLGLIFVTSRAKLNTQVKILANKSNPIEKRLNALSKIAKYNEDQVTDAVIACLTDDDVHMRRRGAFFAGQRKDFRAIPMLIQNLSDNSMIRHRQSGTMLPMVKIQSYEALKKITGKDFGPVEGTPVEIADTVRKWETWWHHNAVHFGMSVKDVAPDYESAILASSFPPSRRLALLQTAEARVYPGLPDIIVGLLQHEPDDSPLKARAVALAVQRDLKIAVPHLLAMLRSDTRLRLSREESAMLPLPAMRANEALVVITGHDYGPVNTGVTPGEREQLVKQWLDVLGASGDKRDG